MNEMLNGVLCVDKPKDFTSFDVIAKLRGILKMRRLGHSGTLDPMATGVLPVLVGQATKACDILPDTTKAYRAGFWLGYISDTLDITGNVTQKGSADDVAKITEEDIKGVLPRFLGKVAQIPPMYSAVKRNGRKLYQLARKGIVVEREPRYIEIFEIKLEKYNPETKSGELYVRCGHGTYMRTLINDMGEALGCGALMSSLERVSSCGFTLDDCYSFSRIQGAMEEHKIEELIRPIDVVFKDFPKLRLDEDQTRLYRNGVKLGISELFGVSDNENTYAIYGCDKQFIGMGRVDREEEILRVLKTLT